MLSYIIHRLLLMIPTLFGITVISFCIMQLAPGDPRMLQLSGGSAGQSTQDREAYRIQKQELHLDKPLILNFDYFRDYTTPVQSAAYYRARTAPQILAEMPALSTAEPSPTTGGQPDVARRLAFLRSLGIPNFDKRLGKPESWGLLAESIDFYTKTFCEDAGRHGVPPAIELIEDEHADPQMKVGAIRALSSMVREPFRYTYSVVPSPAQTPDVTAAWRLWWERNQKSFEPVDAEARKFLDVKLAQMIAAPEGLYSTIDAIGNSDYSDVAPRYFAEKLLAGDTALADKAAAAVYLRQFYNAPLQVDVPIDASAVLVKEVAANWLEYYKLHHADYHPGAAAKLAYIVTDTQYAYMIVRLVTFQFGQSALRTREPVNEKIWNAFVVSAPLIFLSELLIYALALPIGVVCGVYRGRPLDRGISLGLFLLNSIPGFVAAMLCLVFFCYGDYVKLFPMLGLHSDGAEHLSFLPYLADYAWHAFLPVVCLSLFSLAAIAMYARSSMLDVINQDYIRTARAKGLSGRMVIFKHALRNALIPILTLFSTFLPAMLAGSVLIEQLFDIPGMGRLGFSSILQKDFPTLMALLYVEAIAVMLSILATDLLYVLVDPRISFSAREGGMNEGQTYLDIVWRQFRKNPWAYWSLWIVVAMVLLAIFAPLVCSNEPLVFHDGEHTIYPWWHGLFHPAETVDFVFNMALLLFVPWLLLALATNRRAKRRGVPGRRRLGLVLLEYVVLVGGLCAYFPLRDAAVRWLDLPDSVARWIPALPNDPYGWRDFASEQFRDPERRWGVYVPLPFGPIEQDLQMVKQGPGAFLAPAKEKWNEARRHWLGTSKVGEDVLTQIIYGTRVSITIGLVAVSIYATIGIILGALAGYFGGWVDILISRSIETVQMIPGFFLILIIVAAYGPSIYNIMIVIGITGWTGIARLTRGEFLKQRSLDYTAAAQALGASHVRIVFRHILPNSLSPALVSIPFGISDAIVTEAGLSLLGFGIRPPAPSWGVLLSIGKEDYHYWWLVLFPSLAIFLTVTVFNLVGNGLRGAMDPRLRI